LLNRVAGDQVDEKKDETDDQPDDREGVEGALEEGFQSLNFQSVILSVASANALAESKDPYHPKPLLAVGILRLRATVRFALGRAPLRMTLHIIVFFWRRLWAGHPARKPAGRRRY